MSELPKRDEAADKKKDKKADDKKDKKADDKDAAFDRPAITAQNHPNRPILETTLPFNVSGDPIPGVRESSELTKLAFSLEKPGDALGDVVPFDAGYLAVQLKEKAPASKEQWDKNKELYVSAMRAAKANDALIAYIKRLHGQLASDAKFTPSIVEDKVQKNDTPAPVDDDTGE
jgi:peptidyl-prolyl cis-trans isomerase D